MAKAVLRPARYNNGDYLFAHDDEGHRTLSQDPEEEGSSAWDRTDANGKLYIRTMTAHARSGGGWTDYDTTREGQDGLFAKKGYSLAFEPWGWSVSTGPYVDDVTQTLRAAMLKSVGIEQINQAIVQLDQVTQANAGAANEMAATAENLSAEAERLDEQAGYFQLSAEPAPDDASAPAGQPADDAAFERRRAA